MENGMEKEKNIMRIVQWNLKVSIEIILNLLVKDMIKIKILFMK